MKKRRVYVVIWFDDDNYPWVQGVYNKLMDAEHHEYQLANRLGWPYSQLAVLEMKLKGNPLDDVRHCYLYIQNNRIQSVHNTCLEANVSYSRKIAAMGLVDLVEGFIIKKRIRG